MGGQSPSPTRPRGGSRLVKVPVDGSGRRAVVSAGPGTSNSDAAWAREGTVLAYSSDPDGPYRVDVEPGGATTRTGGPKPAAVVIGEPGRPVRRTVIEPASDETDLNPTLAPR